MRFVRFALLALLTAAASSITAPSQTAFTSVRGTVSDPAGAVVPGATVSIVNQSNGYKAQQNADSSGTYVFSQIPPGRYNIAVSSNGFGDQTKIASLLVDQPATVNFTLTIQQVATTVDVSGEAQTLNNTDATIGNSVSNLVIESMPMEDRNVPDLLSLQPGVLYLGRNIHADQDSRSGAVAGARSDQSNVTLDGIDDNDQQGAATRSQGFCAPLSTRPKSFA